MSGTASLACALRGHAPGDRQIENGGVTFARCRRCGTDLIKRSGGWQTAPKGYRVVWRPAGTPEQSRPETPPSPPPPPPVPIAPARPAPAPAKAATILVCDDDPLILDLVEHRLAGRGYRVSLARDGREALARAAEDRPDAIVLDAMMPALDGFEVLRRLREEPSAARIPVIMLTARRQERDIVGALELGADDFMVKPFIPEELLSRIARLLGKARV